MTIFRACCHFLDGRGAQGEAQRQNQENQGYPCPGYQYSFSRDGQNGNFEIGSAKAAGEEKHHMDLRAREARPLKLRLSGFNGSVFGGSGVGWHGRGAARGGDNGEGGGCELCAVE